MRLWIRARHIGDVEFAALPPHLHVYAIGRSEVREIHLAAQAHGKFTLAEFPKTLTKERQRMIIALVRYIRAEAERSALFSQGATEVEAGTRLRSI